jgi:hypothetical protein
MSWMYVRVLSIVISLFKLGLLWVESCSYFRLDNTQNDPQNCYTLTLSQFFRDGIHAWIVKEVRASERFFREALVCGLGPFWGASTEPITLWTVQGKEHSAVGNILAQWAYVFSTREESYMLSFRRGSRKLIMRPRVIIYGLCGLDHAR